MTAFVLYQPDIAANLGAMLRLCACMNIPLHIIEPCGFPLDDKRIRRAGMDYIDYATWQRHSSWQQFEHYLEQKNGVLVLMTTKGCNSLYEHSFSSHDYILFGRESAGVPEHVHNCATKRLRIPIQHEARSLNLALSAAMVAGEIGRQGGMHE